MNSPSGSLASVVRQVRALALDGEGGTSGAFRYRASFVSDIVVYTAIHYAVHDVRFRSFFI